MAFGGIDEQIGRKVDAYRQNPQALQQRYQQNNELLDLLALQKIKSEKESVANEMKMEMQQSPKTIAQQREAEVLDLTKKEMGRNLGEVTREVGGTAQQQQAVQQKNMQRMAAAGPQPQPRPQAGPQQAMPNMARMAGGGIVAFQNGGGVGGGGARGAAATKLLAGLQLTPQQYQALPPEGKRQVQQALQSQAAPQQQQQAMPNMARMPRMAGGGIVSFAEGGQTNAEKEREIKERTAILASVGYTPKEFMARSKKERQQILDTTNAKRKISRFGTSVLSPFAAAFDIAALPINAGIDAFDSIAKLTGLRDAASPPVIPSATPFYDWKRRSDENNAPVSMDQLVTPPPLPLNPGRGDVGGIQQAARAAASRPTPPVVPLVNPKPELGPQIEAAPVYKTPSIAGSQPTIGNTGIASAAQTDLDADKKFIKDETKKNLNVDANTAILNAAKRADKITDKSGVLGIFDDARTERANLVREQAEAGNKNPFAGLRSRSTALGRMGTGTEEARQSAERAKLAGLDKEIDLMKLKAGEASNLGRASLDSATQAGADVEALKRESLRSLSTLYNVDSTKASAAADRLLKVDIANLNSFDKALRRATDESMTVFNAKNATRIANISAAASTYAAELRADTAKDATTSQIKLSMFEIRAKAKIAVEKLTVDVEKIAAEEVANIQSPLSTIPKDQKSKQIEIVRKAAVKQKEAIRSRIEAGITDTVKLLKSKKVS